MKKQALLLSFLFTICFLFANNAAAQAEASVETNSPAVSEAHEMLRSNLLLQDQLHTTLRAIEQARQDAAATAQQNAELFTEKLNAVEKNLAVQRERDLTTLVSMQESHRIALIAAAILASIGVLALFVTAYFQIRAMNRMAEIGALVSSSDSLDSPRALGQGNSLVPAQLNSAEQANARFLAAVEQLEKRIHELDGTTFGSRRTGAKRIDLTDGSSNGDSNGSSHSESSTDAILSKGQALLNADEPEKALACFEEALSLDANNTEALVKKGTALEALRKLPEAIETYDLAIAADKTLTVAYLYKGGVLNRMQRFAEAMECYEKALGSHPEKASLSH